MRPHRSATTAAAKSESLVVYQPPWHWFRNEVSCEYAQHQSAQPKTLISEGNWLDALLERAKEYEGLSFSAKAKGAQAVLNAHIAAALMQRTWIA
jgi:hypothetical protein